MGRKIDIDIDRLFEVLASVQDPGDPVYDLPNEIFEIISDCTLAEIDTWASNGNIEKARRVRRFFKTYITEKMYEELEVEARTEVAKRKRGVANNG